MFFPNETEIDYLQVNIQGKKNQTKTDKNIYKTKE
jgi:hypothetical protein